MTRRTLLPLLLCLLAGPALAEPVTITLLHSNDVYEIGPQQGMGGFAPYMTLLQAERQKNPNSVTTFGGDLLSPSLLSGMTHGRQMIELMDAIGVQVAVPGNHEFDFGPRVASEQLKAAHFPWLGTNVLDHAGRPWPGMVDLKLIEVAGYKLGFLGLLTPETATLSTPGPEVVFAPVAETARDAVRALKAQGADLIIALTHQDLSDDRALITRVEGIDIVLGGHDHDPITFYTGGKLILKAGSDLHYLAAIDLAVDRSMVKDKEVVTWRPSWRFASTAGVAPEPAVQAIVQRWQDELGQELAQPVGTTLVELDTRRVAMRAHETVFGDLVAEAMRNATGAEVGLMNGGGIRGDRTYAQGTLLTRKDIQTEMPFGNVVVLLEIKGADLRAALENGVSQVGDGAGRFPQVAGLRFSWDAKAPAGARVRDVTVAGQPLDPDRTYRLATNDYLYGGGDGYAALRPAHAVIDASAGRLLASTVINYITALGGRIDLAVDGRITRLD